MERSCTEMEKWCGPRLQRCAARPAAEVRVGVAKVALHARAPALRQARGRPLGAPGWRAVLERVVRQALRSAQGWAMSDPLMEHLHNPLARALPDSHCVHTALSMVRLCMVWTGRKVGYVGITAKLEHWGILTVQQVKSTQFSDTLQITCTESLRF